MTDPIQHQLLGHECPEDALQADVAASGGPYVVAKLLRPELDKKAARDWLLNCLNPSHKQNLTQAHIRLLVNHARSRNSTHYIEFWASDNAMSKPIPIEPEDKKALLQKEFIAAVERLDTIKSELGRYGK